MELVKIRQDIHQDTLSRHQHVGTVLIGVLKNNNRLENRVEIVLSKRVIKTVINTCKSYYQDTSTVIFKTDVNNGIKMGFNTISTCSQHDGSTYTQNHQHVTSTHTINTSESPSQDASSGQYYNFQ